MTIADQLEQDARRCKAISVPFNPRLPPCFDNMPHDRRPSGHNKWWHRPFIRTEVDDDPRWLAAWPSGIRYDVRCLDGGAWDRSTCLGQFATLYEAVGCARAAREFATS